VPPRPRSAPTISSPRCRRLLTPTSPSAADAWSAGQRQLVAFARAFLADPAVLILDEATSSLDIPSERLVQRALRTVLADRTALIIAHRLSTVAIADRVLVLEHGRVIEDGTPATLIGAGGRYAALHRAWIDSLA
jgi:ABC-type multidrug transport system fused ATPase/permease subunit